jgi:hypothetical protein
VGQDFAQRGVSVGGLGDDGKVVLGFEDPAQAVADEVMVIDQDDGDHLRGDRVRGGS